MLHSYCIPVTLVNASFVLPCLILRKVEGAIIISYYT